MYEYIPGNIKGCLSEVKILQKNQKLKFSEQKSQDFRK